MKRHPRKMLGGCLPRSLSEERFQEVNALIFEAIVCGDNANGDVAESIIGEADANPKSHGDVDVINKSSRPAMVSGTPECLVLQ
ncbi:hypothetical protein AB3S75_045343 [Citrus x aurantiifolia]